MLFALFGAMGCYTSHGGGISERLPDASLRRDAGPTPVPDDVGALPRPPTPPVGSACESEPTVTCTLSSNELLPDVRPDFLLAWFPTTSIYAMRPEGASGFEVRRGAPGAIADQARWFEARFGAATFTERTLILQTSEDGGPGGLTVLDPLSLEVRAQPERAEQGWLGVAASDDVFGALRVEHLGGDAWRLHWDVFDPSGAPVNTSSFILPPGGWTSSPRYTVLGRALVFGWMGDEGCARALWLRDGEVLAQTVLHCPERAECVAEPVAWTRDRDGRVGVVVRRVCDRAIDGFLVGTLGAPDSTATLTDVCAGIRQPVIALESDGGLRALVTRSFSVYDLRLNRDLEVTEATRVAEEATGLAMSPDGGFVYGVWTGEVAAAQCGD